MGSPVLVLSPSSLSFSAVQGGSNPASQNVSVSNGGGGTLDWVDTVGGASWLSAAPGSGVNAGTVVASVNIAGLGPGTYRGVLIFSPTGPALWTMLSNVETGGFFNSSGATSGTTSAGNFPSGTPNNALIVLACYSASYNGGSFGVLTPIPSVTVPVPSTAGFAWQLAGSAMSITQVGSAGGGSGLGISWLATCCAVYYIPNAAAMASSVDTYISGTQANGTQFTIGGTMRAVAQSSAMTQTLDAVCSANSGGVSSVINPGTLGTSASDFVFVASTSSSSFAVDAGPGYSLDGLFPSPTSADEQYNLALGPGGVATAFDVTDSVWAAVAAGFNCGSGSSISPQTIPVTLVITGPGPGSGPAFTTGFTPIYPPIKKQPFTLWGTEAVRHDSITVDGQKQSVTERIDDVTTLVFPFVALSDMPQWKALKAYALTGALFTYAPILDTPGAIDEAPMFQYPGAEATVPEPSPPYSLVQLVSMDWTPKFESPGIFSLSMKLRLVEDEVGS